MKKCVDGKYFEMTAEEISKIKKNAQEDIVAPTLLERIEAIEAAILEGVLMGD